MTDLKDTFNVESRKTLKKSLNSQVYGGFFSLKIYTMDRHLYKQIKLAKTTDKTI